MVWCAQNPSYPKFALGSDVKVQRIKGVEGCEICVAGLRARNSDVDMNAHINNVTYLDWVLDGIPAAQWQVHSYY